MHVHLFPYPSVMETLLSNKFKYQHKLAFNQKTAMLPQASKHDVFHYLSKGSLAQLLTAHKS